MISDAERTRITSILSKISRRATSEGPTPHKDVFLLALISVFQEVGTGQNRFPLDETLDSTFERIWKEFVPDQAYSPNRIELPFWYLQNDGIWTVVAKPGFEATVRSFPRATRRRILECIEYGQLSTELFSLFAQPELRNYLQSSLEGILGRRKEKQMSVSQCIRGNPFVAYLNTLQGTDGNNKGSLAEAQARNPLFKELRVPHPLAKEILAELKGDDGGHVILTGHAGDGKSTLALEVIRELRGLLPDDPLPDGLKKRESIPCNGKTIMVIKDLSEWTAEDRAALVEDLFRPASTDRFLLVSNTGALLSLFRENRNRTGEDVATIEDRLLDAMDSDKRQAFAFGPLTFGVHNLARKDNLDLGMEMLSRMVHSPQWAPCKECPVSGNCPLRMNRDLLAKHYELAANRIRLLYFRAYAYGERLTMRQMAAHFSFLLTGGATCRELSAQVESGAEIRPERHLFTNLFWGDNGERECPQAVRQLHAVSVMLEQGFNTRFSPWQERRFWNFGGSRPLAATDPELADFESRIRGGKKVSLSDQTAALVRRQYRRLVYFLGTSPNNEKDVFKEFLSTFLDSPRLLDVQGWRERPETFKAKGLLVPIFCVLQEEFSGMRPPDGTNKTETLYITLNRRGGEIRQSVQLVLAKLNFQENFELHMVEGTPALCGIGRLDGIRLDLPLPFLDYLTARNRGELGRGLQRSYRDRIEDFKARILKRLRTDEAHGLVLLQRRTDGKISTWSVKPSSDAKTLEVNHV